jgi:EPS-associated MarR family transcriptional regulator
VNTKVKERRIPPSSSDHEELQLMQALASTPGASQRELASSLGMSLGKANYVLRALIERGFLKAENYRNSRNKLGYLYVLTPSGMAQKAILTRRFLTRKMKEYEDLRLEIEQLKRESEALEKER